ncbi:MAG: hypothetical protein LBN11_06810 [Tannerella sp.]|jgi:hypothetical protein|nr:hypothetical protein [Tannerella sp.]
MKKLKVPYVPELDNIDIQHVSDIMETKALRQVIDVVNWTDFPYKPIVIFDIARSDKNLYINFFVRGLSLKATAGEDGDFVHTDSCVEFFMRGEDNAVGYTNFEFNCRGICHAARGASRNGRIRFAPNEYDKIMRCSSVKCDSFPEKKGIFSWELAVAIPFELMGFDAKNLPEKFFGNFYKCADETENPHFLSWNPIPLPAPDFHCPDYFGEIIMRLS